MIKNKDNLYFQTLKDNDSKFIPNWVEYLDDAKYFETQEKAKEDCKKFFLEEKYIVDLKFRK